jgi:DNA replication and repair protein RecF
VDTDEASGGGTVRVTRLSVVGLRNLAAQEVELSDGLTLLWGPNGAGKTNLLEATCLAVSGRSCRTRNEREAIAFGEGMARVEAEVCRDRNRHRLLWSLSRSGERRRLIDGKASEGDRETLRPALAIFLPDRLALIKGPPAARRAHLDRFSAAMWPSRGEPRRRYGRALAHRNALLGRVRAGTVPCDSLDAWDQELASAGVELASCRREAVAVLAPEFSAAAGELGVTAGAELRYAPRSEAAEPSRLASELRARREADLARGHTTHGPHLDELVISLAGRPARRFGSQGEQRVALLALLFAERRALLEARGAPPLMLMDDVMSELDPERRAMLAQRLSEGGGQALLTATEAGQLGSEWPHAELAVRGGCAGLASARSDPMHAAVAG